MALTPWRMAEASLRKGVFRMIPRRPVDPIQKPPAEPALRPGAGLLMGKNKLGMYVDAPRGSVDFRHPWLVSLAGNAVRIGRGYVLAETAVEPRIQGVPISGDTAKAAPVLELDAELINDLKESWVCLEVTPDEEGKLGEESSVVCVQRSTPFVTVGETGRTPLAALIREGTRWAVWQIAHFHFRYTTSTTDAGRRHFFS